MATLVLLFSAAATAAAEPADYLFGVGWHNEQPNQPYIYRIDLNGGIVWERSLPFTEFGLSVDCGGRNLTEDALYLPIRGESNRIDGKFRIQKYDAAGNLAWDLPLSAELSQVWPNPVTGGCYAADLDLGVYRIDGNGTVLWGPNNFGFSSGPGSYWSVAADPTTGDGFATSWNNSVVIRFDRDGQVVWVKQLDLMAQAYPNPVDGGVYLTAEPYQSRLYRLNPEGEIEWDMSCFPSCYTYPHAVSPVDGSMYAVGGWPSLLGRVAMDGTVLWTVENDDGQGHVFANQSLAADTRENVFYSGETELDHGFSKFNGADCSRIWHIDPGHDGDLFVVFMGFPGEQDPTLAAPAVEVWGEEEGIALSWRVPSDLIGAGFLVYRRAPGEDWKSVSPLLYAEGQECRWLDLEAEAGILFEYEVEVIGPSGPAGRWGPVSFELHAVGRLWFRASPNPGMGSASLAFGLPRAGDVVLHVFDAAGREVARESWASLQVGTYMREWEARDGSGSDLPSGSYWLRLGTPAGSKTTRWTVMR